MHEAVVIDGIKIFGSPYTPSFGEGWAFNVARHKLAQYWTEIPEDTDILVTHGPPQGILDHTDATTSDPSGGGRGVYACGCKALLNRILKVKPKYHIFGHLHPEERCLNAGQLQLRDLQTIFVNAAVVTLKLEPHNNGYVFNI